jgi:hypothetical protein
MLYSGNWLTRASGAVGDVVASHNRGGQYIRARVIPTDPETDAQTEVRGYLAAASARYSSTAIAAHREGWAYYAASSPRVNALGADFFLTPQQQFIRTNVLRQILGLAMLDAAPARAGYPPLPLFESVQLAALGAPGAASVDVEFTAAPASGVHAVWIGAPRSEAVRWFRGPWRFAGQSASEVLSGQSPNTDYSAGQQAWVYARTIEADGSVSGRAQAGPFPIASG